MYLSLYELYLETLNLLKLIRITSTLVFICTLCG
jgi:hypothetical protein